MTSEPQAPPTAPLTDAALADEGAAKAAERIYGAIVDKILAGTIKPGDSLNELALAEAFGVSRTPVREALQHLSIAGLAERGARRAFMVRRLDLAELGDLFETMGEIEALCAQYSARRMTAMERRSLESTVAEGADMVKRGDQAAYTRLNGRFHQALFDGAHNDSLRDIARLVRVRTAPYREAQFRQTDRLASSQGEHEKILAAILSENAQEALSAMRTHVAATAMNVTRMLSKR
ncbi:GntR family transcriptional regulator [Rhodospirillum rubrum]|uniref:Transcriptional regulator, GntR family n=1 Tax=Rhodospirillum rubrum (strain ATCC 11170 / ATH 1.1.1 / DSM 467 / LMG 4362 / NCIMB 8255 / S1) TaxID=269796 RepID=Q2RUP7_RHORT|nr:GntR family transcriptional regulator [Rhodospirillum rubrum]ABC22148.1 transcriptional regulator, GntR family [Rhodospirillum rubrum ATCC 11170]AEO47862.1 GntR family transcriptional regulator [Rhodospirillum rubrum F11]MBK5953736.1 GntR family transcriptional regulator [Rhodospirillum rubrum]QXG81796.1 GntR family transcriptional regulator [Rhodospirillum rubrum]